MHRAGLVEGHGINDAMCWAPWYSPPGSAGRLGGHEARQRYSAWDTCLPGTEVTAGPHTAPRYFPFGIVFLIAGKILEMDDPTAVRKKLGFYAVTVVCGLVVHGLFILPLLYFFITKKNPIVFIRGVLQALLIALATSSR